VREIHLSGRIGVVRPGTEWWNMKVKIVLPKSDERPAGAT
jgi:hypothetical protein